RGCGGPAVHRPGDAGGRDHAAGAGRGGGGAGGLKPRPPECRGPGAGGLGGAEPAPPLVWGFLVAVAIWAVAVPWWSWPVATLADPAVAAAVLGVGLGGTPLPFPLHGGGG